ncbi:MAG: hypothetical protein Kow0029_16640 [Candidatus Rifleibacteriota bacterium]
MKRLSKFFGFIILLFYVFLTAGCIDKTIYPSVELEVTSVSPYELYATATDSASLPTTAVNVTSLNKIPCNLKTYSVSYYTKYGENLPGLEVLSTPIETKLDAEGSISVTVKPYTSRVVDLYDVSNSDISPITARINLVFEDYNGNTVSKEAHCLLYKP